ncbi:MAG: DNA/RNA non-specific endonuclease [Candidatus Margulisbacteria bacterium]|nr:DNA/RNA non-specific endonuclease [Candidatus Margulisiibacteriota bacterium]
MLNIFFILTIDTSIYGFSFLQSEHETPSAHPHILYGIPKGTSTSNYYIKRKIYTLSSNNGTKMADWVAYIVTLSHFDCDENTSRYWVADPEIDPEHTLEPGDYENANKILFTDRGHQAPLASFKCTEYWKETNYLSNITPQKSDLNQGSWKKLEILVRSKAESSGNDIYVITGPLFERDMLVLPEADEPHQIPSGYWKILVDASTGNPQSWKIAAFIFDQDTEKNSKVLSHKVTVDEIEERSGLDFFHALDDLTENKLESNKDSVWIN